jgi:hypothetical protein
VSLVKDEGKVLFEVISHVVAWLIAISTMIFHRRDNNKPPFRADLAATLEHYSDRNVRMGRAGVLPSSDEYFVFLSSSIALR